MSYINKEQDVIKSLHAIKTEAKRIGEMNAIISKNPPKADLESIKAIIESCRNCGTGFSIGESGFMQTYWYENPHGCTDGDTWHSNKDDLCLVSCPDCDF